MGKHYIGPVGRFKKTARFVGRLGSGIRISASFQKKTARLVGRLGSGRGPRLGGDIVPANRVD